MPSKISPRALGSAVGTEMREDLLGHAHSRCKVAQGRRAGVIGKVMIDKQSMQSVLDSPAPGDLDWNMRSIVDVPMPDAPDYSVVEGAHVERAYVVVVNRHYDHIGTAIEPGEAMDLGPD